ncbi:HAD family hydrolase [Gracilimonas sp.]|uniref:HAD family hydrolase n=1 Tax=Gracilimonas sp. TaxID=1974203 RepID=UPI002872315F|nr:HAD hydrolase-like protein [Gracilimonas sp.]
MKVHPWVILFDIDGTLLTVNQQSNKKMIRELLDTHQVDYPHMETDSFSGRTDHDIFMSFLVNHNYDETLYESIKTAYIQRLGELLTEDIVEQHNYVDDALSYFSTDGFITGLLTGNYPDAATHKLKAAKIDYEFSFGAFGEFDRDRNRLPNLAIQEVRKMIDTKPDPSRFIVIGDTPRDVICAKKSGMKCVAVTTGGYSRTELEEHDPEIILDNLSQPKNWFSQIKNS